LGKAVDVRWLEATRRLGVRLAPAGVRGRPGWFGRPRAFLPPPPTLLWKLVSLVWLAAEPGRLNPSPALSVKLATLGDRKEEGGWASVR
jgi:hypothetical protein